MNEQLISAVGKAVKEMFSIMFHEEVECVSVEEKAMNGSKHEISVLISFVGHLTGIFTLKCTGKFAKTIGGMMLGVELETFSEVKDAIAEFLNIIVGAVKRNYSEDNLFEITIPTVISGDDFMLHTKAGDNDYITLMQFKFKSFMFYIEVYLK